MNLIDNLLPQPAIVFKLNRQNKRYEPIMQRYLYTVRFNQAMTINGHSHADGDICTMIESDYNYYKSTYANAITMCDRRPINT